MQLAEPFIDALGPARDVVGATAYRLGYRIHGTGDLIAAIEIPAEIVEQAVTSKLFVSVRMSPDGELEPAPEDSTSTVFAARLGAAQIPIDVLVAQVVAPENLRLEEAGAEKLKTLLTRLERSIAHVKDALARWKA
jgi:hypothetical protein